MPSVQFCNVEVIELPMNFHSSSSSFTTPNNTMTRAQQSRTDSAPAELPTVDWKKAPSITKVGVDEYENARKKSTMMKLLRKKKKKEKSKRRNNNREGSESSACRSDATGFLFVPRAVRQRM